MTTTTSAASDHQATDSIMLVLRDGTAELHRAAEHHPFQRALAKGELPLDGYVAFLGQMLLVHERLEAGLAQLRTTDPRAAAVVTDQQLQAPYLRADLTHFGVDPAGVERVPATARMVEAIDAIEGSATPVALLGAHYVVEGSNNGSKFIGRVLSRQHGLTPETGLRYFDPYGDAQRDVWLAFKTAMDAQAFTDEERAALLAAAERTFQGIAEISSDLAEGIAAAR